MYALHRVLRFDNRDVGLRVRDINGKIYDVDLDLLPYATPSILKGIERIDLVEKNGRLVTRNEIDRSFDVPELGHTKTQLEVLEKSLSKKLSPTMRKSIAQHVFDSVLRYESGAIVKKGIVHGENGFGYLWGKTNKENYSIVANLSSRSKFKWNEDDEFCERQYDAYGVIDDCPKFELWKRYAEKIALEESAKYGLHVKVELEGVKYEITLRVAVYDTTLPWYTA